MVNGVGMQLRILNQNPGGTNEFNKAINGFNWKIKLNRFDFLIWCFY